MEDVIGTRRYIRPLAQLEERVEKLDYERDEKLQRVDKAEKEKAALAEPVRKVIAYLGYIVIYKIQIDLFRHLFP